MKAQKPYYLSTCDLHALPICFYFHFPVKVIFPWLSHHHPRHGLRLKRRPRDKSAAPSLSYLSVYETQTLFGLFPLKATTYCISDRTRCWELIVDMYVLDKLPALKLNRHVIIVVAAAVSCMHGAFYLFFIVKWSVHLMHFVYCMHIYTRHLRRNWKLFIVCPITILLEQSFNQ